MRGEPRIYGVCSAATTRTSTMPSPTLMRASAWLRRLSARRCRACPAPGFIGKAHAGRAPHLPDLLGGNDPHVKHAVADAHAGICMSVGCLLVDAGLARQRASSARPMRGEPRIYGSARRQRPARPPRRRRRSCGHLHGCVGCVFVDAGLARHRASSARPMGGEPRIYGVCSVATTRTSTTPSPTRARSASPSRSCVVERTSAPSSARVRIA